MREADISLREGFDAYLYAFDMCFRFYKKSTTRKQ